MPEKEHALRVENAMLELNDEPEYDYAVINSNGNLEKAVDEIVEIMKKEGYNV